MICYLLNKSLAASSDLQKNNNHSPISPKTNVQTRDILESFSEVNLQKRLVNEIMEKYRSDATASISIFPSSHQHYHQYPKTSVLSSSIAGLPHAPRKGSEESVVSVISPVLANQREEFSPRSSQEGEKNSRSFFARFKNMIHPHHKRFFLNTLDFTANLLMAQPKFNQKFFSVISQISFKTLQKCIGGDIEKVIKQNEDSHEKKMANLGDKADYSHIKLDHLIFIKKLGFGQFGVVYLVKNKDNGALYALKSVSKNQIIEQNLEKHLLQEKQVLETVNFSFIMQFLRTFKDNQSVYFLVEFISGMELFDVIRDIGLLSTSDSQFYIGTLILCMEYLHTRSIIYRDIKPENIMVDSKGYMYMIDMGTAKILKQTKHPGRTFTIIGTPHYMAPEIIQGKGYSYAADLWSVGICLYEFMCGGVPYAEEAEDPYEIYEEIIKRNSVKYPSSLKDKKAKRLIDQLLSKVPELRLGGSFAALKAHPWFDNFNWDELYNKKMNPPYLPPDNKIVHEKDINQIAKEGKLVINEIKHEQEKSKQYNKDRARDPNWDKDF